MRWLHSSCGGKVGLNGLGSIPMTAQWLGVVSRKLEPQEEDREARASRGSSGVALARVFGIWACWDIMAVVFFNVFGLL